ncbi:hypothetical protein B0H13DRAFT_2301311 [Mycena leptocephala]|nr:hypothetical protein B0H13DRAFT_2301311 [Mycena leptocephala]
MSAALATACETIDEGLALGELQGCLPSALTFTTGGPRVITRVDPYSLAMLKLWIAMEVVGLCHSGSSQDDLEGSKSQEMIISTDFVEQDHWFDTVHGKYYYLHETDAPIAASAKSSCAAPGPSPGQQQRPVHVNNTLRPVPYRAPSPSYRRQSSRSPPRYEEYKHEYGTQWLINGENEIEVTTTVSAVEPPSLKQHGSSFLMDAVNSVQHAECAKAHPRDELKGYLSSPLEQPDNMLHWWGHNTSRPTLRRMACDYLQGSATPAERVFFSGSLTGTKLYNSLTADLFEALQLLKSPYRNHGHINELEDVDFGNDTEDEDSPIDD